MIATICVIDDNPANVDLLEQELEDAGYAVISALDGASGIEIIQRQSPDVVLLDIMMPGMSGYEVCRELRRHEETATLPIIMVTAKTESEDEVVGLDAGANDYISKPINIESLLARIRTQVRLKTLQDEIQRNHANLIRAERERQEMISMLTHDMKTPMMTISASLKLLFDRIETVDPVEALKISGVALRSATKLQELVEDFLSLARWDRTGLRLDAESFDLVATVHQVVGLFPHLIREKRLDLDFELPPEPLWVFGDSGLIARVCQNVLSNAIKYNRPGGRIEIRVENQCDTHAIVAIADTGQGIGADVLPRVFEPYFREESRKMIEGSGLGLSVVRVILDVHGSSYDVHSEEGKGTTFRFNLHRADSPESEPPPMDELSYQPLPAWE